MNLRERDTRWGVLSRPSRPTSSPRPVMSCSTRYASESSPTSSNSAAARSRTVPGSFMVPSVVAAAHPQRWPAWTAAHGGYTLAVRLEREDSYLTTFEAAVTESRDDARGRWLALDRSAFYPTSGGQPNDTGTLEAAGEALAVVDVQLEGGTVWHLVEGGQGAAGGGPSAPAPGTSVTGWIDWERRYRH